MPRENQSGPGSARGSWSGRELWQDRQILTTGAAVAPDCLLRSSASFTPDDESNSRPHASPPDRQRGADHRDPGEVEPGPVDGQPGVRRSRTPTYRRPGPALDTARSQRLKAATALPEIARRISCSVAPSMKLIGESRPAVRLRHPDVDAPVPLEKAWFDHRQQASYEDSSWRTEGPELSAGTMEGEGQCRRLSMQKIQAPPTGG